MTEAAFKKKKNTKASSGERISTHPSYTEYSWDSIMGTDGGGPMNGTAAAPAKRMTAENAATLKRPSPTSNPTVGRSSAPTVKAKPREEATLKKNTAVGTREAATVKKKIKSVVKIHTITAEKKYAFPMSVVLIALCFTVLVMSTVTTLVKVSEITTENSALQSQYNSLLSEENELRLLLETRDDLRVVEAMAKDELGMVKKDQVDRYYLTVQKEDRIEIVEEAPEESGNIFDDILSFGGTLVERIRNAFGF